MLPWSHDTCLNTFYYSNEISVLVEDGDVAGPQLVLALFHLHVGVVCHLRMQLIEEPQGLPTMIDEDVLLQIDALVGIHHKAAKLR